MTWVQPVPLQQNGTVTTEIEINSQEEVLELFPFDLKSPASVPFLMTDDANVSSFMTTCWNGPESTSRSYFSGDGGTKGWRLLSDEQVIARFARDGASQVIKREGDYGSFFPCSVISSSTADEGHISKGDSPNGHSYTVRIFPSIFHDLRTRDLPIIYKDYPRSSIQYFTKPGLGDQHLQNAFRHHIGIPEAMFPSQWKNT